MRFSRPTSPASMLRPTRPRLARVAFDGSVGAAATTSAPAIPSPPPSARIGTEQGRFDRHHFDQPVCDARAMPGTMNITVVPHTHWDREWYQPFEEFRDRLVGMMDALLELGAAGFPHFHLDGQTAMVDDYLAVRPENEAVVRALAA